MKIYEAVLVKLDFFAEGGITEGEREGEQSGYDSPFQTAIRRPGGCGK